MPVIDRRSRSGRRCRGNGDDGPTSQAFNLDRHCARPSSQRHANIDGYEGTYKTLEFSANKRYGNRWSMNASFSYTWTEEFGNLYFNNRFGTAVLAATSRSSAASRRTRTSRR